MFVNLYMGIGDIANGRNGDKKEERGFRNTFITYVDKLVQVLDKGITVVIIFYEVHNQYFAFGVYVHFFAAQRPGATFLLIPPTARATAMAYAYTAIADDASANYYNAAGLVFLESPSFTASYFTYLTGLHPDMHYFYFGAAYPLMKSAWGFDFIYYTLENIRLVDEQGVYLDERLIWRIAPKISYARRLSSKIALGISWKFIKQQYGLWHPWELVDGYSEGTGSSWAFDVGFLCNVLPNLTIGSVLHNAGPSIKYKEEVSFPYYPSRNSPLPWLYRLGLSYKPIDSRYVSLIVSAELTKILIGMFADEEKTFWENVKYEFDEAWKGIGLEWTIYDLLSLRGGYFYDSEGARDGFTFGGGVHFKGLAFDIGIDENIFDFVTQNRKISLSYTF